MKCHDIVQVSEKTLSKPLFFFHLRYTAKLKIERNSRKLKCKKENVYFFCLASLQTNHAKHLSTAPHEMRPERGRKAKNVKFGKNTKICTLRALANISAGPFSH
jgi:hypothetical protein